MFAKDIMIVKDIRLLQYGKIHEVYRLEEDKIITTTGIVLYNNQFEFANTESYNDYMDRKNENDLNALENQSVER